MRLIHADQKVAVYDGNVCESLEVEISFATIIVPVADQGVRDDVFRYVV